MKLKLDYFKNKYASLSDVEFEKIVLGAASLNQELIDVLLVEARKRNKRYAILENLEKEYKQKGYPDYFEGIDMEDIKRNLSFLKSKLPKRCTKNNYQLTHTMLNANYNKPKKLQEKLQRVADLMRAHLQISETIKIITINNIGAGKFEMIDNLNCIFINGEMLNQNFYQKVAILAHEMSHYFLMRRYNIIKPIEKENELLTEINAIYIGFGFLLLKGYVTYGRRERNKVYKSKVGYIKEQIIKDAIIETAYVRKQKPQWIIKNVALIQKIYFHFKLRKLIKAYRLAKSKK